MVAFADGMGLPIFSLYLTPIEVDLGGINTEWYLGELLEKECLINSLNFDLGRIFESSWRCSYNVASDPPHFVTCDLSTCDIPLLVSRN
jgi:hypothetical protein